MKFTQAAAEDAAQASKLANTLRNAAGASKEQIAATEKWIAAQGARKRSLTTSCVRRWGNLLPPLVMWRRPRI